MANKKSIYTVGGTVQAGGGIYIKRRADDDLLQLCRQGDLAFILSSRQVGKSSLMTRTAEQLESENIRSSIIDLSSLGTQVTPDEWYLGILNIISNDLNLEMDLFAWWRQYQGLGPAQRFFNFLRDMMLREVRECVVLFFDEIDTTLSLAFADDFFTTLRAIYNARSNTPDFKRLSFVLVGVATPGDLISDSKRTPFNIGRRVEINDFTLAEALPLAQGLGDQAVQVLTWIFQYTSGHPYLTQRLCANLASSTGPISEQDVERAVEHLFTGEQGKQDNNLQFVRDMLSKRSPDVTRVLMIYRDVRSGKRVVDDERSIAKAHLKLSGLVRSEQGILRVRNEIYNRVFNSRWVEENTPKNWQKVALVSISVLLGVLVLGALGILINDFLVGTRVNNNIANFISTTSPTERLSNLAAIYREKGILQNTNSNIPAAQLFYSLPAGEQTSMLTASAIAGSSDLQNDLVTVIRSLYVTVADVDPTEDNTGLLESMYTSLAGMDNNPTAVSLRDEINSWLDGREKFQNGNFQGALADYNNAITVNDGNQATLFERAKVYVALQEYTEALQDLDAAIVAAKQSIPDEEEEFTPGTAENLLTETSTPEATPTQRLDTATSPAQTAVTTNQTPVSTLPATLPVAGTSSPDCTCKLPATELGQGYESNFTTLIEVINAVRGVIAAMQGFQPVSQADAQSEYSNLQSYGLVREVTPTLAPLTPNVRQTAVPTDTVSAGEPSSTPEPPTFTPEPADTQISGIPIGEDWIQNCISALWMPYPVDTPVTVDQNGCLAQNVGNFYTGDGNLTFEFSETISGTAIHGLFAQLPPDGTVSLDVNLAEVTNGEVLVGIFEQPDVFSNGVFVVFPGGEDTKEQSVLQQTILVRSMPDTKIFSETTDALVSQSGTYDVFMGFDNGSVNVQLDNNQINLGTVDLPSEEKWLFLGYQELSGANTMHVHFSNLVVQQSVPAQ